VDSSETLKRSQSGDDAQLSNLDAQLRVATRAEIIDLHQRISTTTMYVTHDQVEAMTMGNRVAVLSGGLIQQFDVPQESS
jgi:multiple sugar transport system ATP-binding protein